MASSSMMELGTHILLKVSILPAEWGEGELRLKGVHISSKCLRIAMT